MIFRKVYWLLIAICLFIGALIFSLFPILPGFILFFAAVILLTWVFRPLRHWLVYLIRRSRRSQKIIFKLERKLKKWFGHRRF